MLAFGGRKVNTGLAIVVLLAGFVFLVKGADFLVDGAIGIARRLNISNLVIGLTVVAFGTSTPELFVNITAGISGNTDIAVGNVLGSNIANIFLILGVSAVIYPLEVTTGTVWKEIPFSLLATCVLAFMANDRFIDGANVSVLSRIDGCILLCFFSIFLYYSFSIAQRISGMEAHVPAATRNVAKSSISVIIGLLGLGIGGKWIVDSASAIASGMGVSESLIGLTVVAVGTSLPELATSAVAAFKKNSDIAVGNVVGSNIFNIFLILGIGSIITPLPFREGNNIDIGVTLLASLLLFLFMFTGKRHSLDRWEGVLFLFLYTGYLIFLIFVPK